MWKCLLNYYITAWRKFQKDSAWGDKRVKIERRHLDKAPEWEASSKTLNSLQLVKQRKGIEDFRVR
jgi:hypothetical protein